MRVGLEGLLLRGGDWRDTDKEGGSRGRERWYHLKNFVEGGDRRVKDEQL